MTRHNPLCILVLALCMAGCGGGASVTETSTNPDVLRDVPELRAASEGSGGTSEGGGDGGGGTSGRFAASTVSVGGGSEQYTGRFGGPEPATSLSDGCPGWVAAQPNHIINVPNMPFAQLVVDAPGFDTTLAVQLPDGSFLCNDDTNGLNPAVHLEPLSAGQLRVWVGAYSQGTEGEYRMTFTTDRSMGVTPEDAPPEY